MRDVDLTELCDMNEGVLSPRVFADPDLHRRELEQIFGRCWVVLCPEQQIPRPGDFFTTYVGADRVIVVRQKDGSVKALLNQCRHRANELVRADSGSTKMFTCSYHGWAYDLEGKLRSIPRENTVFPNGFDKAPWGCVAMAQVDTYKGLVFGTWDPTAPTLLDYLGDGAYYLDLLLDRYHGLEMVGGVNKWVVDSNWKLVAEQFAGDMLHPETAHLSAIVASLPEDFNLGAAAEPAGGRQFSSPEGHGAAFWLSSPLMDIIMGEKVARFWNESHPTAVERLGKERAEILLATSTIFPTTAFISGLYHLRVLHPVAVDRTEIWSWQFVPAGIPADIQRDWSVNMQRAFGAGGLFETDDSAIWTGIQRAVRGVVGQRHMLAAMMGDRTGNDEDPTFHGRVERRAFSEMTSRGFYQRWLELLTHDTWSELNDAAQARFAEGALR